MLDPASVAGAAVVAMAPYTPYLLEIAKAGGKKLAEVIAEKGGESAWNKAGEIWKKIKDRSKDDPEVEMAAKMIAFDPENEDRQAELVSVLTKRLQKDKELLEQLSELLGGQDRVQEMIADQDSLMLKVSQKMKGVGTQTMKATGRSKIIGATQTME